MSLSSTMGVVAGVAAGVLLLVSTATCCSSWWILESLLSTWCGG